MKKTRQNAHDVELDGRSGEDRHSSQRVWAGTPHDEAMQITNVDFGQRGGLSGEFASAADGLVKVERFEVVFEGFARNGYSFFDYECRFDRAEGISFDCV